MVSRIVAPSRLIVARSARAQPQLDVDAGGRLVEDQQPAAGASARGRGSVAASSRRRACGCARRASAVSEKISSSSSVALAAVALRHAEVAAVEVERLLGGQEPVEVDLLRREPDRLARALP